MGHIHGIDGSPRSKLKHAAATSAALSALFLIVYGACNAITAQRSDVGTLFFHWEKYIPFVPIMILPYMSIDLFFVGAPFICSDNNERRLLAKRISFAILVAGVFFLAMPLRFAFPRPTPQGWTADIFSFLHAFDQPFNLFPSLHITLRTILADTYTRHTKGILRWAIHVWFSLIGFSTVLTYQHHVMDVVGGFILAAACFYIFRQATVLETNVNKRIGAYYAVGAAFSFFLALLFWPWGSILLWPATSLSIAASAYFGLIKNPYRKEDGRLPLSSKVIMAPNILGQILSLEYYKRRADPWNEAAPGLWIGRKLNDHEAEKAIKKGVTAVLDVTSEFPAPRPFRKIARLSLPILDLTAPSMAQLEQGVDFIRKEIKKGIVYVHCKIGYSRSAVFVGAHLMSAGISKSAEESVSIMRNARPSLIVRPEAIDALRFYEENRNK